MSTKVLIPVDGSPQSFDAIDYGCALFPEAMFEVIHVIDTAKEWPAGPGDEGDWEEQAMARATDIVNEAISRASRHVDAIESVIEWGEPFRFIVSYLKEQEFDHVVMGATGSSTTGRLFLGSISEAIVRRAPTPVTIVRLPDPDNASQPPSHVLTPVDGSDPGFEAMEFAIRQFNGAEITVLTVCNLDLDISSEEVAGTYLESSVNNARNRADQVLSVASERATDYETNINTAMEFGRPAHQIIQYAENEGTVDHIVIGSKGQSRVRTLLLGSVAETVAKRAPVSVTIHR